MRGSLGKKIGEGGSADIHAWAPGLVVKLFKAGCERRLCRHEAQMTRAAFAAGLPVPEVFDEVVLEGRFGIVLSHLDGPTLLQLSRTRAMAPEQAGAILAALAISVHKTPPPADVISLRDLIHALVQSPGNLLPKHLATGVLALLESVPAQDGLCHGDLHPGNVIMTAAGPRLIDWTWTRRAGPGLDLGHCHVVLCELIPENHDDPERPRALNAAVQSEYARLAGMSPVALTAVMESYLPIVRAFFLLVWAGSPALRERLTQRIEAALQPED
jgi:tRNA A-37 threonylcarbamoyl transferase component Bud32